MQFSFNWNLLVIAGLLIVSISAIMWSSGTMNNVSAETSENQLNNDKEVKTTNLEDLRITLREAFIISWLFRETFDYAERLDKVCYYPFVFRNSVYLSSDEMAYYLSPLFANMWEPLSEFEEDDVTIEKEKWLLKDIERRRHLPDDFDFEKPDNKFSFNKFFKITDERINSEKWLQKWSEIIDLPEEAWFVSMDYELKLGDDNDLLCLTELYVVTKVDGSWKVVCMQSESQK